MLEVELPGNMLSFNVGGKQAFEVSIADVSQTSAQGKNDVMLEFHVDDTTGANEVDTLMEMAFYVPNTNTTYVGDDETSSAQVFEQKILARADVGPTGDEALVNFMQVGFLTPRGRFKVELHQSFLRLQGQAVDFKIQYSSVLRLFILPKIEYVEFERHGAGTSTLSSSYFDLIIKLRSDQEHLFRNIQRNEYHNLYNYFRCAHALSPSPPCPAAAAAAAVPAAGAAWAAAAAAGTAAAAAAGASRAAAAGAAGGAVGAAAAAAVGAAAAAVGTSHGGGIAVAVAA
eukprot:jgi/Mesen1/5684/ME000288S04897